MARRRGCTIADTTWQSYKAQNEKFVRSVAPSLHVKKLNIEIIANKLHVSVLFTFCRAAHSQSTKATVIRCRADLEFRWKSRSCPKDSAGRISCEAAFSWGSQIHLHKAPSNLDCRDTQEEKETLLEWLASFLACISYEASLVSLLLNICPKTTYRSVLIIPPTATTYLAAMRRARTTT